MNRVWATPLLLLGTACAWGEPREDVPGDFLGDFDVEAALVRSSCGPGALGAPDHWEFEIRLSRLDAELFWVNGQEVIAGSIDDKAGRFDFETRVLVAVEPPDPPDPGCSVNRFDAAEGTIKGADLDIRAFSGSLSYRYSPTEDSDCFDLLLAGTLAELPCAITYRMEGKRTRSPTD